MSRSFRDRTAPQKELTFETASATTLRFGRKRVFLCSRISSFEDSKIMPADEEDFEALIPSLMEPAKIPGLSMFTVCGEVETISALGIRDTVTRQPIDAQTSFEAASLSKPVVAHAALQLVDAGRLDLDEPLSRLIGPLIPDDPAVARITARHVLSHTTGLPNWRSTASPLRTYFPPGSRFSYSGEGFVYLQSAMEHLEGEPLDTIMKRLVLDPFGMHASSYVWRETSSENVASPHNEDGQVGAKYMPAKANAAASLHTTAPDYGRFVVAAMAGARLKEATARSWLTPQIQTPKGRSNALDAADPETEKDLAWGLGWGLELEAGTFFHWGSNPGATAFVLAQPAERSAVVVFINSDAGYRIVPQIVQSTVPGQHPSLSWLGWQ